MKVLTGSLGLRPRLLLQRFDGMFTKEIKVSGCLAKLKPLQVAPTD